MRRFMFVAAIFFIGWHVGEQGETILGWPWYVGVGCWAIVAWLNWPWSVRR